MGEYVIIYESLKMHKILKKSIENFPKFVLAAGVYYAYLPSQLQKQV